MFCSMGSSLGSAITILRLTWAGICFSFISTEFHKVCLSANFFGAFFGSKISEWTSSCCFD